MLFETTSCIIKYCISLKQSFSPRAILSLRRQLTISGDIFDCLSVRGGGAGIWWVAGRGAAKFTHRAAPPQRIILPNSADVETF